MAAMIALATTCLVVGSMLSARYNYLALIPATLVTLAGAAAVAYAQDKGVAEFAILSAVSAPALQAGYLGSLMLRSRSRRARRVPKNVSEPSRTRANF